MANEAGKDAADVGDGAMPCVPTVELVARHHSPRPGREVCHPCLGALADAAEAAPRPHHGFRALTCLDVDSDSGSLGHVRISCSGVRTTHGHLGSARGGAENGLEVKDTPT